jgi:hypothetical protein
MEQLKLKGIMSAVKDINSTEEVDNIMMFLQPMTDPKNITHDINFWRGEVPNATAEEKILIEDHIKKLKEYLMNQGNFAMNVYSYEEVTEINVEDKQVDVSSNAIRTTEEKVESILDNIDPSVKHLHLVKDKTEVIPVDEDRILREKYKDLNKEINVDALKLKVTDLLKAGKEADAIEVANFILKNGFYKAKHPKHQTQDQVNVFIETCRPKSAPVETKAEDTDLHTKYASYTGDNAPTVAGLKADTKFDLSNDKIDVAMERATFLLSEGLCNDSEGKKWSNTEIEAWFKEIKEDMIKNPLTKNEEEPVVDTTKVDTSEEAEKAKAVETSTCEIKMADICTDIKNKILVDKMAEDQIKAYILDTVYDKKVELVESFCKSENTPEQIEDMYVRYFKSYVDNQLKSQPKEIDITEEITKAVSICVETKEKGLGKAIQKALGFYRQKGETPQPKEVKEIVYNIAKEKYPEFYEEMIKAYGSKETKVNVAQVDTKIDFTKKHPEVWESIKDTNPKSLDDVYNMARELEKTQSFVIVSEMIIYLILSGKINDKEGNPVKWELPAIEMWINTQFAQDEKTGTKTAKEGNESSSEPAKEVEKTKQVTETEVKPVTLPMEGNNIIVPEEGTKTVEPEVAPKQTEEIKPDKQGEAQPAVEQKGADGQKPVVGTTDPNYSHLGDYVIPEEHLPFKALYAKKKEDFHQGFTDVVIRLVAEGKGKTDIKHEIADVIKAIAMNNKLTQTFARNFVKTSMTELYKTVEDKAVKLEIKEWIGLKD